jgi:tripartite-type tricarboxylate transporter receptor subunit TctC
MAAPDFKIMMEGQGFELVGSAPEECDRFIASEITKWTKVVKDAGIKPM